MKLRIYVLLVNRISEIRIEYQAYRNRVSGFGRIKAWLYLFYLNIYSVLWKKKFFEKYRKRNCETEKALYASGSESSLHKKLAPIDFANQLMKYDVISFDVFDTLIFRFFSKPSDLFFMVGKELHYMDFERIRIEIEEKARRKKGNEVTFEEIWDLMEEETGIDAEVGKKMEWDCELKFCFANPYMSEVIKELQKKNKKIIITSDMYLSECQIRQLLEENGYPSFTQYFVSSEHSKAKYNGEIFDYIKEQFAESTSFCHVGDNEYSDIIKANEKGFNGFYYPNINKLGMDFRTSDMSVITGSMYQAIVNAKIYNGLKNYSMEYEFGYIYGGLFVLGYCQFIHDYVEKNEIDKILFLARDGDIIHQAYKEMYPLECTNEKTEYVYWSRLVATKMSASYFKYDYFRRFLFHKINQGYSLEKIFCAMEIVDLLDGFLILNNNYNRKSELTDKNVKKIKNYLLENWLNVISHYEHELEAGKIYYSKVLKNCKRVAAVDVGWAGSGAIALDYVVNKTWKLDCKVVGILAGTNSLHNEEANFSESFFYNKDLVSYMYSQEFNRDIWKFHDLHLGHNIIVESLLSSNSRGFKGFQLNNKSGYELIFSEESIPDCVLEIQKGILDFVRQAKFMQPVSGRDAYSILKKIMENDAYCKVILEKSGIVANVG